jgi:hypothetical protein
MKRYLPALIFTIHAFLLSNAFAGDDELIPLQIGNTWEYVNAQGGGELKRTFVDKKQVIDGQEWFLLNEFGSRFWVRNGNRVQYEAVDYFDMDEIDGDLNEEIVLDITRSEYTFEGVEKVISGKCPKQITVPAGTFDCYAIQMVLDQESYSVTFYALGVGVVKSIYHTPEEHEVLELKQYKLH